jgi:hypothetical protein
MIQRVWPDVNATSMPSDRSFVEPQRQAFRTCGMYDSEAKTAATPPM